MVTVFAIFDKVTMNFHEPGASLRVQKNPGFL